jgi:hypothetical protein
MVEPLIKNTDNNESKSSIFMANSFAKILWKKKFKKSEIQKNDDQIVTVVQEVYLPPEQRKDEVWDWILDRSTSFLVHAAYKHRNENIVMVCYRGTDFKDMKDLLSDVQIVLWVNWIDSRVQDSLDFFDDVQMKYPNTKKRICGHSLWWTISYIVNKHREPERCIVFNPGASPTKTFIWMMQDTLFWKAWTKRITTYKIRWDVVSTLSFIGNVKNFTVKSVSPLKLHSIDTFPELFKEMNNEK